MKDYFFTDARLLGLIGHPIKHTFSPFIHNKTSELLGDNTLYLPFDVAPSNLKDALAGFVALGVRGVNVTTPHKEAIIPLLHYVSEEAGAIGSVNTVVNEVGKLSGHNTDSAGIIETLEPYRSEIVGNGAVVVGAGGAARAAVYTLIRRFNPSRIFIVNRTKQRAEYLKDHFAASSDFDRIEARELTPPDLLDVFAESKLIVNATTVGMWPHADDAVMFREEAFDEDQIVFDMVYNPLNTKLTQLAERSGARATNGLPMLLAQAAKSYELWTGAKMPVAEVETALKERLASGA